MIHFNAFRIPILLTLVASLLLVPALRPDVAERQAVAHSDLHPAGADDSLSETMIVLWQNHVVWTRLFIISDIAGLPDRDLTAQRLLQNQVDIGNALAPYYGREAADQLISLLQEHILGASALLDAAKSGDQAEVDAASDVWYANGDDIAAFLNALNPEHWPLDVLQKEMKMHLDLTLAEATARLTGDFATDIKKFDEISTHILGLAAILTQGIQAQFPDAAA